MNLFSFALGSVVLAIKLYADFYEKEDLELTLTELKNDASLPRIKTYDFIIGTFSFSYIVIPRFSLANKSQQ